MYQEKHHGYCPNAPSIVVRKYNDSRFLLMKQTGRSSFGDIDLSFEEIMNLIVTGKLKGNRTIVSHSKLN